LILNFVFKYRDSIFVINGTTYYEYDFNIEKQTYVVVLGETGAGKSHFIKNLSETDE
jgi:energy-coupling factor transporter ATP-binding protein EcfA2